MSKIKIITDAASDISSEDELKYGIRVIPFQVILGSLIFIALLFYRLKHGRKAIRLGGAGTSCCSTMPNLKGGADQ